jgi:hypothetical protein
MNFSEITEKSWIYNNSSGKNYDIVTVTCEGLLWRSYTGAPHTDYDIDNEMHQAFEDFIIHGSKFQSVNGPVKKGLQKEIMKYIADYAQNHGLLCDYWEYDSKFIQLSKDHIIAGKAIGSFPGGDIASSWPVKGFTANKAIKVLNMFKPDIIHDLVLTIKLREYLKQ